jgi:hypothetical protein
LISKQQTTTEAHFKAEQAERRGEHWIRTDTYVRYWHTKFVANLGVYILPTSAKRAATCVETAADELGYLGENRDGAVAQDI